MATLTMSSETLALRTSDTFASRTVSGSFGTSDSPNADTWAKYGTGTLNVGSNEGQISSTTGNVQVILGSQTGSNTDVTTRFALATTSDYAGLIWNWQNSTNYYACYYNGGTYRVYKFVSGTSTQLTSFTVSTTAGTYYYMRVRMVGTQLQARVWLASNTEPTTWNATIQDSTYSSGNAGVIAKTSSSSPAVNFDSYVVSTYSNADYTPATDSGSFTNSAAPLDMSGYDVASATDSGATTTTQSGSDTLSPSDKSTSVRIMQGGDSSTDSVNANDSGVMIQGPSNMAGIDIAPASDYDASSLIVSAATQQTASEIDTFAGRTLAASTATTALGTASNGDAWIRQGNTVTAAVSGGEGQISSPTGNAYFLLGSATGTDGDVSMRFAVSSTSDIPGVMLRFTNTNNYYRLDITNNLLRLRKVVAGVSTYLGTPNYTITPGTFYWMHLNATGTTVSGRIWPDGQSEPTTWNAQGTDTALSSGQPGMYANPISTTPIQIDHFSATVLTGQLSYADSLVPADSAGSVSIMSGTDVTSATDSGSLRGPTLNMAGTDVVSANDSAALTTISTLFEQSNFGTTSVTRTQIEAIVHDVLRNEYINGWNPNAYYTGNGQNIPGGLWINWEWNNPSNTNRQGDGVTNQQQYQGNHDPQTCMVYLHAISQYLLLHPEDASYFNNPSVTGTNLNDFTNHVINDFIGYRDIKYFVYNDLLASGLNLGNAQLVSIAQSIAYNQMNNYKYGYFWKTHSNGATYTSNYAIGEAAIVLDNVLRYPTQSYTGSNGTVYAPNDMIAAAKSAIDHIISVAREPNYGLFFDAMNVDSTGNGNDTPLNSSNTCLCRVSTQIEAAQTLFMAAHILNNPANANINPNLYDPTRAANYINVANTAIQSSYNLLWDDGSTILNAPLTQGSTYTSITVQNIPYDYPVGTPIIIGPMGGTQQTVYVTQDAQPNYTSIKVASAPGGTNFVAASNFAAGVRVSPAPSSTVPLTNGGFFYSIETNYYKTGSPNTSLDPTKYVFNKSYKETRSTAVTLRTASLAHNAGDTSLDALMQQCVNTLIDPTKFYKVADANNVGYVYEVTPSFGFFPLKTNTNGVPGVFVLSQFTTEALGDVTQSLMDAQATGAITQSSSTFSSSTPPQYVSDASSSVSVMSGVDQTPYATGPQIVNVPWNYQTTNVLITMSGVSQVMPSDYDASTLIADVQESAPVSDVSGTAAVASGTEGIVPFDSAASVSQAAPPDIAPATDSGMMQPYTTMAGVDSASASDRAIILSSATLLDIAPATDTDTSTLLAIGGVSATSAQDSGLLTNLVLLMGDTEGVTPTESGTVLLTVAPMDAAPATDTDTSTRTVSGSEATAAQDSGVLYISQVVMSGTDIVQASDTSRSSGVAGGTDAVPSTDTSTTLSIMAGTDVASASDTGVLYISFIIASGIDVVPATDSPSWLIAGGDTDAVQATDIPLVVNIPAPLDDAAQTSDYDTSSLVISGTEGVQPSDTGAIINLVLMMFGMDSIPVHDRASALLTSDPIDNVYLYDYGSMIVGANATLQYVSVTFPFRDRVSGTRSGNVAPLIWNEGQTYPLLLCVLRTDRDRAVDLSNATSYQLVLHPANAKNNAQDVVLNGSMYVLNKRQSILSYTFADSDVATVGNFALYLRILNYNGREDESDLVPFVIQAN